MENSWICVDASLLVRLTTQPDGDNLGQQIEASYQAGNQLAAPTLLYYEVTNALYQYLKHQHLTPEAVEAAQEAALAIPISLFGDPHLHRRAIQLASELSLSATYDAHYLALAQVLNAELWTADKRLAHAVQDQPFDVHLVA